MFVNILSKIEKSGVILNPKSNEEDLSNLESKLNFKFPQDFKNFYLTINGFADYMGVERQHVWDVNSIIEGNSNLKSNYVIFCDFMFRLPWIGYSRKDYKIYKGNGYKHEFNGETELVAETFEEFMELISIDSKELY